MQCVAHSDVLEPLDLGGQNLVLDGCRIIHEFPHFIVQLQHTERSRVNQGLLMRCCTSTVKLERLLGLRNAGKSATIHHHSPF